MTRHQIRVSSVGANSQGACQGSVTAPTDINWNGHRVRVSSVTLPAVPILAAIEIAVTDTVTNSGYDMPDIYSLSELVNWFDSLTNPQTGARIMYAFYLTKEFEVCIAGAAAITLDAGLAALLKLPTTIPAAACLSSHVDPATWTPLYRGYVVKLIGTEIFAIHTGEYISDDDSNDMYEQTVAEIGTDQDCSRTPQLSFRTRPQSFSTRVYFREMDGSLSLVPLGDSEYFEVALDLIS